MVAMVAVILAGCAGSSNPSQINPGNFGDDPNLATLMVTVTDEEVRLIEAARVTIQPLGLSNFTGSDGRVIFAGVEPGPHNVRVEAYGHQSVERAAELLSGAVVELTVVLPQVPSIGPYSRVLILNGISSCTVPLLFGIFDFGGLCENATVAQSHNVFFVHADPEWALVKQEMAWAGSHWFTMFTDRVGSNANVVLNHLSIRHGPSVIRVWARPGEIAHGHDPQYWEPYPATNTTLMIQGMFAGYLGEAFEPLGSTCNVQSDAGCMGVGTGVEMRFTLYVSLFYHAGPPDPEAYSAVPDS